MRKCLDAGCDGRVIKWNGQERCNKCGIVQNQNFKETLGFLDKEVRKDCNASNA